ncbi:MULTISPECIES: SMP-30/gluconolactonase/LRE family protein [Kocuria]|uniref:SMP-30/gluconolactonase/LRE family protein n=1 Tax=Kocuria TaxID=57493 RepID=UPI0011A4E8E7|nr:MULTISPECIES: SMP-30/gluconolactonase/LRE family protein [Kocuria]MBS6029873.1 SMP-30/gluconolactonase/LRE family protein [Kocuria rhizophila]
MKKLTAQRITPSWTYHGEGPCWSAEWGGLAWVDMLAGDVMTFGPLDEPRRQDVGAVAACVRPRETGGQIIAVERGVVLTDREGTFQREVTLWDTPDVRMNEGGVAPDGSFYVGSMAYDQAEGEATLYRVAPDLDWEPVLENVTISNGIAWSPDGALAYYNDTPSHEVVVFDWFPEAGLQNRRSFVRPVVDDDAAAAATDPGEQYEPGSVTANPDGLTVDSEGAVWTALNGSGQVHRYLPDGTLDTVVSVGAKQVTACTLGGEDLRTLYITTSRENLPADVQPTAGSLYSVRVAVPGQVTRAFAG